MSPSSKDQATPPPPGAPAAASVPLEEPTEPHDPLPPKPEQQSPATVSPTGADLEAPSTAMSQQGAFLTTSTGARLRDTDHSLRAGSRGPTLLQDHHLREKITHFDHERIPERVVHARGAGAHGVFVGYGAASDLTSAAFLEKDVETPVFVRFSTVAGSRGSADTVRDTRGFAVKFYTEQGNFDLVGNNIPVFFIQDGIKFPDVIHAVKPHPDREIPQAQSAHDTFWDFVSLHTEAQHHTIWAMSDRAIPRSYRHMEGFGVHTFRLVDADGRHDPGQVPLEARASACTRSPGRRPSCSGASTPTSTVATCTTPSRPAPTRSGSSASRPSRTPLTRPSRASTCSTRPSWCPRSSPRCSPSAC